MNRESEQPTERPEGWWGVRDTNARQMDENGEFMARGHEPVKGKIYYLRFDTETYMPEEHARKFLRDQAFIVTDANGEPVASLNKQSLERKMPSDRLPANMVIASLEELSHEALLTRSAQRPRFPKFNADTRRDVMIRFLQDEFMRDAAGEDPAEGESLVAGAPERAAPAGDPAEAEDMDEAEAARMLEGR